MGDAIDKIGQAQQGVSEIITVENTADMIEELAGMQAIQFTPTGSDLTEYGNAVNFATTSPSARGKKSTFTGNEAHAHGHEVHREQRGFCPSAP